MKLLLLTINGAVDLGMVEYGMIPEPFDDVEAIAGRGVVR
jgi:hypothetical protein